MKWSVRVIGMDHVADLVLITAEITVDLSDNPGLAPFHGGCLTKPGRQTGDARTNPVAGPQVRTFQAGVVLLRRCASHLIMIVFVVGSNGIFDDCCFGGNDINHETRERH
jgi:hypothetical protein